MNNFLRRKKKRKKDRKEGRKEKKKENKTKNVLSSFFKRNAIIRQYFFLFCRKEGRKLDEKKQRGESSYQKCKFRYQGQKSFHRRKRIKILASIVRLRHGKFNEILYKKKPLPSVPFGSSVIMRPFGIRTETACPEGSPRL